MRISPLAKTLAALALAGSLSVSANAQQEKADLVCSQNYENGGNSQCDPTAVPEPGMLGLLGLGLAGIIIARRRR